MKLHAFVVLSILGSVSAAVASCGSEDGSSFSDGSGNDGGTPGTPPPSFVKASGEGGPTDPGSGCTKLTCADLKINCGPAGDGCGGVIADCGQCPTTETCGGGGTPSVCGGASGCVKKSCADLAVDCGPAGDGCGGTITCPACNAPDVCGGGGPSKCGVGLVDPDGGVRTADGGTCTPRSVCVANECGPVADGCGGLLTCPVCTSGTTCGGGGVPSMCGAPACTATTCVAQNANCGFVADGCGGILNCGGATACTVAGEFCGGAGANRCGNGLDGGNPNCTNLCLDQPTDCSGPNTTNTTTITGTVYMPNGTLPLYNALVYVPNGTLAAMPEGNGTCDTCSAQASGAPLVNALTDSKGQFTLSNMPYRAAGVPLVIQAGRWRKLITVKPTRCGTVNVSPTYPQPPTANNTTLGATQTANNNIPKFAVTSGTLDSLQCLLRKIGIADSEFGAYPSTQRVHVYHGYGGSSAFDNKFNGCTGGGCNLADETTLYGNVNGATGTDTGRLTIYDGVVLSCTGDSQHAFIGPDQDLSPYLDEVRAYADAGGKIFGSHWHHYWLEKGAPPWGTTGGVAGGKLATVDDQSDLSNPVDATINTAGTFAKGNALADWLVNSHTIEGTTARPRGVLRIGSGTSADDGAKHTIDAVDTARVNQWISVPAGTSSATPPNETQGSNPSVQYFDFFTPVGAATQCGRYVVSDLHVATAVSNSGTFPIGNCGNNKKLTDQERVLAFMLFDLTACIQPIVTTPPTCTMLTCAQQNVACGLAGDGCGGQQVCPACPANQVCQGNPPACVPSTCVPLTCASAGKDCGTISNGCGGTVDCPPCTGGKVCGGAGPNKCGSAACVPTDCSTQNIHCGPAGDGCGGPLDCGPCPSGETCGGGGTPYVCGAPACTPRTCSQAGANCGFIADGCGSLVDCGPCPSGQSCGGGGVANQCASDGVK